MLASQFTIFTKQQGFSLFITLIVLLPMMLAATALTRSVDTAGVIMGNVAFKQAATRSADCGIEAAITWLQVNGNLNLYNSNFTQGYAALRQDPSPTQTWDTFWVNTLLPAGQVLSPVQCPGVQNTNSTISYTIQRLCNALGNPNTAGTQCSVAPASSTVGNSMGAGAIAPTNFSSQIYYRITVRVDGLRSTVSYVQVIITM